MSVTDAVLKFTDLCYTSLNEEKYLLSVFLDFSKAFDTVVHDILCKKLDRYGIRGHMNDWFKSYLSDRNHYVDIMVLSPLLQILHVCSTRVHIRTSMFSNLY